MRILLIDDDTDLCDFLKLSLKSAHYSVDVSHDGLEGSYLARTNEYDMAIIDLSLPKKNGLDVCKDIRATHKKFPIIILSVTADIPTKISLLDIGADDYLCKPFSFEELLARLRALTRRPRIYDFEEFCVGDLTLNTKSQMVRRGLEPIYLTKKEYSLLEFLVKNAGHVMSRGMIMEHVWSIDTDPFSNTIESHVLNLRRKMNTNGRVNLIHNVPGRGYAISATNEWSEINQK